MSELRLGKMSTKELAQWMGVNYNTFRNQKKKKLKVLQQFCDFEQVYGGVIIKEIYESVYKSNIPNDKEVFLNEIKIANQGLSSIAGMSRKLKRDNKYYGQLSERQVSRRMSKWNVMFGKYNGDKQAIGKYGCRRYVYAIRVDIYNNYRPLTDEESELFRHILKSICGKQVDKIMQMMLLDQAFKNSDMTKEEYFIKKERFDLDLFPHVLQQFKKETGLQLVRIQEYKINGLKLIKNVS